MIQENEIPKYLKSTESNISKSNRKSKHKHHYEECLIQNKSTFAGKTHLNTGLYTYCTICGKINERFKETLKLNMELVVNSILLISLLINIGLTKTIVGLLLEKF